MKQQIIEWMAFLGTLAIIILAATTLNQISKVLGTLFLILFLAALMTKFMKSRRWK